MKKPELIKNNVFVDNRGTFAPLSLKTLNQKWIQSNISINPNKYTLRGLHYQYGKSAQAKLLKVIDGKILDFIIDLRPYSPEYNKISFFILEPGDELYVLQFPVLLTTKYIFQTLCHICYQQGIEQLYYL